MLASCEFVGKKHNFPVHDSISHSGEGNNQEPGVRLPVRMISMTPFPTPKGIRRFGNAAMIMVLLLAFGGLFFHAIFHESEEKRYTTPHRIHVAFGFHVNLYHSFRNDTNDENGFGKDIRIIRHTIATLDRLNSKGIPVIGVWDFDNLFSLQEILPRYAPDIIEDIQRRVRENGDEVILMSYNNGLVSAMTKNELDKAVAWAVSNPWKSGIQDLFGTYTPIVRPQEMMTTPGNFSLYTTHGIQAVALYYSSTPFDAFRMFSRQLTREEAHNPVRFRNSATKEEMVVIPTYHVGDLIEHVNLREWACELHDLQEEGRINRDALIFINFDADSEFWSGIDMPWPLKWIPYTGGLAALVDQVEDLPFAEFTTPGAYLNTHSPRGDISFTQDTADGSFNGYNSWAEKHRTTRYWTAIEKNREMCSAARRISALENNEAFSSRLNALVHTSFMTRLRALSTTNFGMATPDLAPQREQAADRLTEMLNDDTAQIERIIRTQCLDHVSSRVDLKGLFHLDDLRLISRDDGDGRFITMDTPRGYDPAMDLVLVDSKGNRIPVTNLGANKTLDGVSRLSMWVIKDTPLSEGIYRLCALSEQSVSPALSAKEIQSLTNGPLSVRFKNNRVNGIYLDGVPMATAGSLMPSFTYHNHVFEAQKTRVERIGPRSVRITGELQGPGIKTVSHGYIDYRLTLIDDLPYLVVQGSIRYPATKVRHSDNDSSLLKRRGDPGWQDVAPVEIRFAPRASMSHPVHVIKRNYLGIDTEYVLDYFRHDLKNLNLDNVNNHITESYVGVTAGNHGMVVAMDTSFQSNFAFSPLSVSYEKKKKGFSVKANPFGTYSGRQYTPQTWGNGNGFEATLAAGEQFAGAGSTYNGAEQRFNLMIGFFNGHRLPGKMKEDMIAFAHSPTIISSSGIFLCKKKETPMEGRKTGSSADPDRRERVKAEHAGKLPLILEIKVLWAHVHALLTS